VNAPRKPRHKDRAPRKAGKPDARARAPEAGTADGEKPASEATGPRVLPPRRDGKLPAERLPVILEVGPNDDYALLDSGDGQKLERYGDYRIVRPEAQAIWRPALP